MTGLDASRPSEGTCRLITDPSTSEEMQGCLLFCSAWQPILPTLQETTLGWVIRELFGVRLGRPLVRSGRRTTADWKEALCMRGE